VTDGTAAGTSELRVAGTYSGGLFYIAGNPLQPNFTIFGSKVLFQGRDANNVVGLWVTDATAAGTTEVAVSNAYSTGLTPSDITVLATAPPPGDFNGDGKSDILWQNDSGEAVIWELNGTSVIGGGSLGNPGLSWHAVGTGDFNGDGRSDILWQNSSGEAAIWEMNGTSVIGGGSLGNPGPS
jgi:ELWxxDGT repeat protein